MIVWVCLTTDSFVLGCLFVNPNIFVIGEPLSTNATTDAFASSPESSAAVSRQGGS